MTTYIADLVREELVATVHFKAGSWRRAENIARREGWTLIGQYIDETDCPSDVAAMIEKHVTNPTLH